MAKREPQPSRVHNPRNGQAPAFQVYASDRLSDVRFIAFSAAELGAFHALECAEWRDAGLPADPETLAAIARVPLGEFDAMWERRLAKLFKRVGRDRLELPDNAAQRASHAAYRARQSENGKRGGRPRKPRT